MGRLITKVTFKDQTHWIELAELAGFRTSRLAQQLGLSRRQVERYVKRHFSLTPKQWLSALRMARAAELVRVMNSVKEIAYALGFTQVSTFCRQFKAHFGMTCSEYAIMISTRKCIGTSSNPAVTPFRREPAPDTAARFRPKPAEVAAS